MGHTEFRCRGCQRICRQRGACQRYCGARSCQQKRRNAWRREEYATDEAYRLTARASTEAWLEAQGGAAAYYRSYRLKRKEAKRAGEGVKPATMGEVRPRGKPQRGPEEAAGLSAKRDAKEAQGPVITGEYLLIPSGGTKRDAILVQLRAISMETADLQRTTHFQGGPSGVTVQP
jgi:hypothetical protein